MAVTITVTDGTRTKKITLPFETLDGITYKITDGHEGEAGRFPATAKWLRAQKNELQVSHPDLVIWYKEQWGGSTLGHQTGVKWYAGAGRQVVSAVTPEGLTREILRAF